MLSPLWSGCQIFWASIPHIQATQHFRTSHFPTIQTRFFWFPLPTSSFFLDAKKWFLKMVLFHMEDTAKCQISIEKVTALIETWGLFGDPKFETTSQNGYGSKWSFEYESTKTKHQLWWFLFEFSHAENFQKDVLWFIKDKGRRSRIISHHCPRTSRWAAGSSRVLIQPSRGALALGNFPLLLEKHHLATKKPATHRSQNGKNGCLQKEKWPFQWGKCGSTTSFYGNPIFGQISQVKGRLINRDCS